MLKKRRLIQFLVLALICAALLFTSSVAEVTSPEIDANNSKIDYYREQAEKLQRDNRARETLINSLRGDINRQNDFIREVNTQIKQIEAQINAYIELIEAKQAAMDAIELEIIEKELQIENTMQRISQRELDIELLDAENTENIEKFGQLVAQMYMNSGNDVISLLVGSANFYDVLVRTEMIRNIGDRNIEIMTDILESITKQEDLIDEFVRDKSALELERFELNEKKLAFAEGMRILQDERAEIVAEVERQYSELRRLTGDRADIQNSMNTLSTQTKSALTQLDGINKAIADLERANKRIIDAIIAAQNPDQIDYSGDGFMWPVERRFDTTCLFDCERDKVLCSWCRSEGERLIGRLHTGVDFAGSGINGTNIFASQSGTVIRVVTGHGGGLGHHAVIDHGGGYATMYAHMLAGSPFVKVGDEVKKGDVIGKVGNTGWSSGAHLHFEIIKDGTRVNPLNYIRQ